MPEQAKLPPKILANNREILVAPLRQLQKSLQPKNLARKKVRDALDRFSGEHGQCMEVNYLEEEEPWHGCTGVHFGVGKDVDQTIDTLIDYARKVRGEDPEGKPIDPPPDARVEEIRIDSLVLIDKVLPAIETGKAPDVVMGRGRKRRATKKKAKKARRFTRRR
jgi:hypothetical protein